MLKLKNTYYIFEETDCIHIFTNDESLEELVEEGECIKMNEDTDYESLSEMSDKLYNLHLYQYRDEDYDSIDEEVLKFREEVGLIEFYKRNPQELIKNNIANF